MSHTSTNVPRATHSVVVDIVETLETCGLEPYEYQLNDAVDVDALERVLKSSDGSVVQFTVEGSRLSVTKESVDVLNDEEPSPPDP